MPCGVLGWRLLVAAWTSGQTKPAAITRMSGAAKSHGAPAPLSRIDDDPVAGIPADADAAARPQPLAGGARHHRGEAQRAEPHAALDAAAEEDDILDLALVAVLGRRLAEGDAQRLGPQQQAERAALRRRAVVGQP